MAVGLPGPPVAEELIAGRYRLSTGPVLGSGAWCTVHRALDTQTGLDVAVKTYNSQAVRELGDDGLSARFTREVSTFEALEIGPSGASAAGRPDPRRLRGASARLWLVNLLDYSRSPSGAPGRDADGRYYTVLELAEESLAAWLRRRAAEAKFVAAQELSEVASSVGRGLRWLHSHGLCHLDVKPENIMRFGGGGWKLIDLEGCLRLNSPSHHVTADSFTPLYACPELASHALLGEARPPDREPLRPTAAMDMWALGVVLLDVLTHGTAFEELKAGFAAASLFDEEDVPFQQWFQWVADDAPVVPADFVKWPTSSARLLAESVDLQDLLKGLLHKEPDKRLTANDLHKHRFLLAGMGLRREVEATFQSFKAATGRASVPTQELSQFFTRAGLRTFEAAALLQACDPKGQGHVDLSSLLEFVYR